MKNSFFTFLKTHWSRILSVFFFVFLSGVYMYIFAVGPFTPGETLDPGCGPTNNGCTVTVVPTYTNSTPTLTTIGGVSSGSTFAGKTLQEMFDDLLYPYTVPTITLSISPSAGLREFGNDVTSVDLTATTTKQSDTLTSVVFKRDGVAIDTNTPPASPSGGTETYTEPTDVTTTTTFTATVNDGTTVVTSNSQTYTFVYAYYYGVGAQGLTGAQIAGLTKSVIGSTSSVAFSSSPSSQVWYFAYPAAYPALTSILDNSGFETIADYTVSTTSITNTYGQATTYRVYEFNNPTTQTSFTNTFIQ